MSDESPESGTDVSPKEVSERLARGEIQLIDVRETYEHAAGHVAGARHIELPLLTAEAETIDRDRPVVFLCRVGNRSRMATEAFRGAGYDAHSMAGGIVAWVEEGLPLEPEDGRIADH
ncbi:MAG TPA: rhodanese-like domain-containing protein [Solirubrobacteraceae bacterium]|nr:rhodanese-like domain-containing protein [Solirubrobacteraceae bacterium]